MMRQSDMQNASKTGNKNASAENAKQGNVFCRLVCLLYYWKQMRPYSALKGLVQKQAF